MTGFTLIELLVVLFIGALILALSIPSQHFFLQKTDQQVDSLQLLKAIHFARNEALMRKTTVELIQQNTWEKGYLINSNQQTLFHFENNMTGKLHLRMFPLGRNKLTFLANGQLDSENGTFWYCVHPSGNPTWALVISKSGRARLVYPDVHNQIKDEKGMLLVC